MQMIMIPSFVNLSIFVNLVTNIGPRTSSICVKKFEQETILRQAGSVLTHKFIDQSKF